MQELLKNDKLLQYEPSTEGARKFISDNESDEQLQELMKSLNEGSGSGRKIEEVIAYLIKCKKDCELWYNEQFKDGKNASGKSLSSVFSGMFDGNSESGAGATKFRDYSGINKLREHNFYGFNASVANSVRMKMSQLGYDSGSNLLSASASSVAGNLGMGPLYGTNTSLTSGANPTGFNGFSAALNAKANAAANSGIPAGFGLGFPIGYTKNEPSLQYDEPANSDRQPADFFLTNLEMERDFTLAKLTEAFYSKYCKLYWSDNEKEKAANLKLKVKLSSTRSIFITRNELDDHISKYRSIYSSMCSLRHLIDHNELKLFEDVYTINNYFMHRTEEESKLSFEAQPFKVVWLDKLNQPKYDEASTLYIRKKIFDNITIGIYQEIFEKELGEDIILSFLCRKHQNFLDFMIRVSVYKKHAANSHQQAYSGRDDHTQDPPATQQATQSGKQTDKQTDSQQLIGQGTGGGQANSSKGTK